MSDTGKKLVYMANQIGSFYNSYPHDQAVKGISEHIKKFWDPRMLNQIFIIIKQPDHGLKANTLEALQTLAKSDPDLHSDLEASG